MRREINSVYIVRKLDVGNDDQRVNHISSIIKQCAKDCDYEVIDHELNIPDESTLMIAVGGDGTMLYAMRLAYQCSGFVIGVNLGKVGFLTDLSIENNLYAELHAILSTMNEGNYNIERRMGLITGDHIAFNEFVVSNKFSDQHLEYNIRIGNVDAGWHKANGVIISTPTGSTAYSLSAGGSLMFPTIDAVQIVPIAPISMTSRPLIVPITYDQPITVNVKSRDEVVVKGDGQYCLSLQSNAQNLQSVTIERSLSTAIIHPEGWSFFETLSTKLGWKKY